MAIDRLPQPLRRVTTTFNSFTAGQKAVTITAVLALAIGGYFFATWASTPTYATLFSNLSSKDASAIVESLQKSGTPYELANGGQTVMVPSDQVYDLRLQLSGEGLPGEADTGYALLDQQGVTTSDFMQHVGYQRALEGELANTIKSIEGVEAATVHLVIPQKDVFADEENKTTASVLVASKPPSSLSTSQVQAIVHLVASSVEGLSPEQVTVAGADGKILSTGGGDAVATAGGEANEQQTVAFQKRLSSSLQDMLDKVVGPGHAVVTTTAELDFDRTETKTKTYGADPALPPSSEQTQTERYNGTGSANGGVLGPDNVSVPNGSNNGQYESSNTTKNNLVNETNEVRQNAPGKINKLNVAVLMDSTTAGTIDAAEVTQLVSAAAGIDKTRGDTVAVSAMPFDTSAAEAAQQSLAASAAAEKTAEQSKMIKIGAMVAVVVILLLLAWRASRRNKKRTKLTAEELAHLEEMQAALEMQRLNELNAAIPQAELEAANREDESRVERQREIEQMVEEQPDEVAMLLRGWLATK